MREYIPRFSVGEPVLCEVFSPQKREWVLRWGRIKGILLSNKNPSLLADAWRDTHTFRFSSTRPRVGVTYFVERTMKGRQKPHLYWPRTNRIIKL